MNLSLSLFPFQFMHSGSRKQVDLFTTEAAIGKQAEHHYWLHSSHVRINIRDLDLDHWTVSMSSLALTILPSSQK